MVKHQKKSFNLSYGRIPPQGLSPGEIFQFLKDYQRGLSHQTKVKEGEFYEVFFYFFIDYFYMQENITLKDFMNSLERDILVKMLDRFNGNQKDTATFLGVNHTTLNQKVRKHKISFFKRPIEG
jgi:DNA-binding NtrC family response regulator